MPAPAPSIRPCIDCVALETALCAAEAEHDRAFNDWLGAVSKDQDLRRSEEALQRTKIVQDQARRAFSRHNRKCVAGAARRRYTFATSADAERFAAHCREEKTYLAKSAPQSVDVRAADDAAIGHYDRIAQLISTSGPVFIETSSGKLKLDGPLS